MRLLTAGWRVYQGWMAAHPLKTQMATSGTLCGLGDVISQLFIEKKTKQTYSYGRNIRFFVVGAFYIAPGLKIWFKFLETYVRGPVKFTPLIRVCIDQFMFGPCFLSSVLINLHLLEGNSLNHAVARWRAEIFPVYTTGLMIWPAAQLFNFYLVPLNYRVPFVQFIGLFWNTYLAWRTSQDVAASDDKVSS